MTTNLERIRQMNSEELADMLSNLDCSDCPVSDECDKYDNESCYSTIRQWLEQEVEE